MEIFGRVTGANNSNTRNGDIGIYIYNNLEISFSIRKKEIQNLERVLFGFEDNKLYFLNGEKDSRSLKISSNHSNNFCTRTRNKELYKILKNCEGEYEALWDKNYKEWYIILKNKENSTISKKEVK